MVKEQENNESNQNQTSLNDAKTLRRRKEPVLQSKKIISRRMSRLMRKGPPEDKLMQRIKRVMNKDN